MEGDTGGSREAKKSREHYANTDREIDQYHLAELLRKSADIVERGEFGSVLYEALQDFRVYYKQKYPKNAKKKKGKKEKETLKSERGSRSIPVDASNEKQATASNEILDDLKHSEEKISNEPDDKNKEETEEDVRKSMEQDEKKLDPDGHTGCAQDESDEPAEVSADRTSKVGTTDNVDATATATVDIDASARSVASAGKIDDSTPQLVSEDTIPVPVPTAGPFQSTADVSEAPPTPSISASVQMAAPIESTIPIPTRGAMSDVSSDAEVSNSIQSPFKQANPKNKLGFGKKKFKLGATLQNVKKAAKNVKKNISENIHIDKRTSSKARDELEFFAETGMDMAESSGRRTQASGAAGYGQSRVTAGMAGASTAGSSEYEYHNNEFVSNQSHTSSPDHHGRPGGDRDFGPSGNPYSTSKPEDPTFFESPRFAQGQQPPVTSKVYPKRFEARLGEEQSSPKADTSQYESVRFSPRHQPAGYSFYKGEGGSEDGDLNHPEFNHSTGGHNRADSAHSFEEADPVMECDAKPKFQRPDNPNSPLVVSGWIEQYRRSKMRLVWKEVLASLVEGRQPGEVTTLWIQREMINPATGEKELEALHRIPLQILEDVSFTENTTDNQFRLKIYNSAEDFVFRCTDAPNDALRWVQTLRKYEKLTKDKIGEPRPPQEASNPFHHQPQGPSTKGMPIRDLRAICHGAGVNTAGMERSELEAAAEEVQRRGTYFDGRGAPTGPSAQPPSQQYAPQQQQQQQQEQHHYPQADDIDPLQPEQPSTPPRMGIKELRAICHGAGINTVGMERRELEAAAQEVQSRGTYFDAPVRNPAEDEANARREELRRQQQQQEEMRRRQEAEERHRREVEIARQRAAFAEQEARRKAAEEEARRRAEEARRRAAAEEQMRRQREAQEAQKRYAQQQAAWQQQHQAEEQRRRAAEQQAAAEHRRREEARRKEQEWSTPAPGAHPQQHQYHHHQQQRHQGYSQQQWQQPHQQQHRPPPQQPHHQQARPPPPPQQQQQQRQHSGADNKYAKMASQSDDDGQAAITKIKHNILIQWALQPPQLQMLRPIAALITTIHTVFPPSLGVSGHDYFKKWKPITREDLAGVNGLPEEAKLKKSVRKIRFFLHPDKLPHDLDEEQKFTVKMLWDITNDSWEEYQKHKEDLDWVN